MKITEILSYCFAVVTLAMTVFYQFIPIFRKRLLLSKMLSSASFMLTGIFAAISNPSVFSYFILAALFLCFLGDYFLDVKNGKLFFVGVLFFSLGHITYIYTFLKVCSPDISKYLIHMIILFLTVAVMGIIHIKMDSIKFSGKYKVMILYSLLLILSFTVSTLRGYDSIISGNKAFGILLALGGGMFMISDAFLASQLFGKPKLKRTDAGVALFYFPAQALFGLSILFY